MSASHSSEPESLSRRQFVTACSAAVGICTACASLVTRRVTPTDGVVRLSLAHYPDLQGPRGFLKILPDGSEHPLYVLSLGNNTFSVVSPICTHLGCTVEPRAERLVCPCHGSTYDREGTVIHGPAARSLARYPASLSNDGWLSIDLRAAR
jgi:Rieske Fe-S protein